MLIRLHLQKLETSIAKDMVSNVYHDMLLVVDWKGLRGGLWLGTCTTIKKYAFLFTEVHICLRGGHCSLNKWNHSLLCNETMIKRFDRLLKFPIVVFLKMYFLPTVVVNSWLLQIPTNVAKSKLHPCLRLLVNCPYYWPYLTTDLLYYVIYSWHLRMWFIMYSDHHYGET